MADRTRPLASLRLRLTVVSTAVVVLVLAASAVALVTIQRQQLTSNLDSSLQQRADAAAASYTLEIPVDQIETNDDDRALQLVAADGEVLVTSTNLAGSGPLLNPLSNNAAETELVRTESRFPLDDDAYRVLTRRIETAQGPALLHVAENRDDLDDAVGGLAATLALVVPTIAVLLAGLMWWLTGRTLKPVDRMRAQVDAISSTDLDQRIDVPVRDDEIGRLAATMNRMLDRLTAAAERQRQFVADAAHELRTPLTRIRADVEVDLDQPSSADPTATLASVRDETVGLQQLIDDLLHLARSDAGQQAPGRQLVDLDEVVMGEINEQRRTRSQITVDASGVSAAPVVGDAAQLTRAVRNVLINAGRHARSAVAVTLQEVGPSIELIVTDDGPGVASEHQEEIFERFARVDAARARVDGGTGLGLAITKDIVEAHGGTICYDSSWTDGARFVVRLPAGQALSGADGG